MGMNEEYTDEKCKRDNKFLKFIPLKQYVHTILNVRHRISEAKMNKEKQIGEVERSEASSNSSAHGTHEVKRDGQEKCGPNTKNDMLNDDNKAKPRNHFKKIVSHITKAFFKKFSSAKNGSEKIPVEKDPDDQATVINNLSKNLMQISLSNAESEAEASGSNDADERKDETEINDGKQKKVRKGVKLERGFIPSQSTFSRSTPYPPRAEFQSSLRSLSGGTVVEGNSCLNESSVDITTYINMLNENPPTTPEILQFINTLESVSNVDLNFLTANTDNVFESDNSFGDLYKTELYDDVNRTTTNVNIVMESDSSEASPVDPLKVPFNWSSDENSSHSDTFFSQSTKSPLTSPSTLPIDETAVILDNFDLESLQYQVAPFGSETLPPADNSPNSSDWDSSAHNSFNLDSALLEFSDSIPITSDFTASYLESAAYMCCQRTHGEFSQIYYNLSKDTQKQIMLHWHKNQSNEELFGFIDKVLLSSKWSNIIAGEVYVICQRLLMKHDTMIKFIQETKGNCVLDYVLNCHSTNASLLEYITECTKLAVRTLSKQENPALVAQVQRYKKHRLAQLHSAMKQLPPLDVNRITSLVTILTDDATGSWNMLNASSEGKIPLHVSCSNHMQANCQCLELVHILLVHGHTDPNFKDPETGDTPLHIAVYADSCAPKLVSLLLSKEAYIQKNYKGYSPLDLACKLLEKTQSPSTQEVISLLMGNNLNI